MTFRAQRQVMAPVKTQACHACDLLADTSVTESALECRLNLTSSRAAVPEQMFHVKHLTFHQHRWAAIDDPLTEPPNEAVSRETLSRDAPSNLPAVTERHPLRDALRHAPAVHRASRHARAVRYALRRVWTHSLARRGPSSRPGADGLRAPRGQSPDATSRSAGAPKQEVRLQPQITDRGLSPLGADTAATFHLNAKPAPSRHRMRRPHAWARQSLSFERPSGGVLSQNRRRARPATQRTRAARTAPRSSKLRARQGRGMLLSGQSGCREAAGPPLLSGEEHPGARYFVRRRAPARIPSVGCRACSDRRPRHGAETGGDRSFS